MRGNCQQLFQTPKRTLAFPCSHRIESLVFTRVSSLMPYVWYETYYCRCSNYKRIWTPHRYNSLKLGNKHDHYAIVVLEGWTLYRVANWALTTGCCVLGFQETRSGTSFSSLVHDCTPTVPIATVWCGLFS